MQNISYYYFLQGQTIGKRNSTVQKRQIAMASPMMRYRYSWLLRTPWNFIFSRNMSTNVHEHVAQDAKKNNFGFQIVTEEEKARKVQELFSKVASRYDLMNDVMSMGVHRLWKDHFVNILNPTRGIRMLDVAGGTGDVAFRVIQFLKNAKHTEKAPEYAPQERDEVGHVTVCDVNPDMLKVGENRAKKLGYGSELTWVEGDALNLPFDSNSFDAYTVAFGIRNMANLGTALQEAYRVLKPGGRFLCLEFSHISNPLLEKVYDFYSFQIIPVYGQIIANDWNSYQYLVESIRKFQKAEDFEQEIKQSGFRNVYHEKLLCGVVAIHSGFKL